jgi:VanZ family protein
MHKTAAWPLVLLYGVLIVYASLFPFANWREIGADPWHFLLRPLPKYWSGFDVAINVAGYVPFGGLLALAVLRSGRRTGAVVLALLAGFCLSLVMESIQNYLPGRVSSKEDLILNTMGSMLGALLVRALDAMGVIGFWSRVRTRWFVEPARGGIVLLALWPAALLFPAAVPFGLGQVVQRFLLALQDMVDDSLLESWLPVVGTELQPLTPFATLACVMLGVLIPSLLGFCVVRSRMHRAVFLTMTFAVGVAATGLSSALSWGPEHAWAWLDEPTRRGLAAAALIALALAFASWRVSAVLAVLALGVYLSILNQAPVNPYFAQTLQTWEQGRFVRFHGVSQWLGWLWPYATLGYVMARIWQRDTKN